MGNWGEGFAVMWHPTLYTHMNDFPSSIHTTYTVIPKALIFWALICPLSYNPRNYHDWHFWPQLNFTSLILINFTLPTCCRFYRSLRHTNICLFSEFWLWFQSYRLLHKNIGVNCSCDSTALWCQALSVRIINIHINCWRILSLQNLVFWW